MERIREVRELMPDLITAKQKVNRRWAQKVMAHAERHRRHVAKQEKIKAQLAEERCEKQPKRKPLSKYANRKGAKHKGYNLRSHREGAGKARRKTNVGHRSKIGGRRK